MINQTWISKKKLRSLVVCIISLEWHSVRSTALKSIILWNIYKKLQYSFIMPNKNKFACIIQDKKGSEITESGFSKITEMAQQMGLLYATHKQVVTITSTTLTHHRNWIFWMYVFLCGVRWIVFAILHSVVSHFSHFCHRQPFVSLKWAYFRNTIAYKICI